MKFVSRYGIVALLASFAGAAVGCDQRSQEALRQPAAVQLLFVDARRQAEEFIGYYHSIAMTPEQDEIKRQALTAIPAPCCDKFTVATCCCPCNLAKSVWGLAHYLIAERGCTADEVRDEVERWIEFTHAAGYEGDACFKGRCGLPFSEDGCGGMHEGRIS